MHLGSHLLISWLASTTMQTQKRERILITAAGVVPDLDALGPIVDFFTRNSENPTTLWDDYHHILCHNLSFSLLVTAAVFWLAKSSRLKTALLGFAVFHLHLICDLAGSRGPDGYQWPITYLFPFSDQWQLTWSHQWAFNAWPNMVITLLVLAVIFRISWKRSISPFELVSLRVNTVFVEMLRRTVGKTKHPKS